MTRGELRTLGQTILNFNTTGTDQEFTSAQWNAALNRALRRKVNAARKEAPKAYFMGTYTFTWPALQQTMVLPSNISKNVISQLRDVTNSAFGSRLFVRSGDSAGGLVWDDNNTLRWGLQGPASARSIKIRYSKRAPDLLSDDDEPELIPEDHHEMLAYSASAELAGMSRNGEVPKNITLMETQLTLDFLLEISKQKTVDDGNVIEYPDGAYELDGLY